MERELIKGRIKRKGTEERKGESNDGVRKGRRMSGKEGIEMNNNWWYNKTGEKERGKIETYDWEELQTLEKLE